MATLDGSSGQTTSTLHIWGGGRGKRMGPKRGPCIVYGGAVGPCHSSFGCDSTPDPEEAGRFVLVMVRSGTMGVKSGPATSLLILLPFITVFEQMVATAAAAEHFSRRQGREGASNDDKEWSMYVELLVFSMHIYVVTRT